MPNNRRLPRNIRNVDPSMIPGFIGENRYASLGSKPPTVPPLEQPSAPKHFPSPNIPIDGDLFFEFLVFFFSGVSMALQFLHLYHTVWWTPNSHISQAVNYYLIDINLVAFVIVLLSRRLIYLIGTKIIDILAPPKYQNLVNFLYRSFLAFALFILLGTCTYHVVQNNLFMNVFYLGYPISVYFVLFGFKTTPFFELVDCDEATTPPLHACTSVAGDIRQEVDKLKSNFNSRLKQILFSSVLNAYYAGFVPCCFAQNYLHYDIYWATQHTIFILLSCFVAYCCQILHPRYCDVLHRSALHLGTWIKVETRNIMPVNNKWNEETLFPYGALVRHGKDMYRAQGECNSCEPSDTSNLRFYALFKNPSIILKYLLLVHGLMVLWQLYLVYVTVFWHNTMSLAFMMFFNYYFLYKVLRDYFVCSNIYKEERLTHERSRSK
ncbi:transmembrane protein 39A [Coccinella septempunctata]|uniref:transmembrane protein 39A n=1 Tax=Coccinella septempunctata TaxID=41139 RepID=UPI001D06047E|nr:transmembrane protein 39A [Coccinella septempunctata]